MKKNHNKKETKILKIQKTIYCKEYNEEKITILFLCNDITPKVIKV